MSNKIDFVDGKMRRAICVLDLVRYGLEARNELKDGWDAYVSVEPFLNGREEGFKLSFTLRDTSEPVKGKKKETHPDRMYFWFFEGRNHDGMVVVADTGKYAELKGELYSDKAWKGQNCFSYPGHDEAATYIVKKIEDYLDDNHAVN